jgi:hypothetical protein
MFDEKLQMNTNGASWQLNLNHSRGNTRQQWTKQAVYLGKTCFTTWFSCLDFLLEGLFLKHIFCTKHSSMKLKKPYQICFLPFYHSKAVSFGPRHKQENGASEWIFNQYICSSTESKIHLFIVSGSFARASSVFWRPSILQNVHHKVIWKVKRMSRVL